MALWDEVKSRYSAATLRGLTNADTPSANTINDAVGILAATDVQADFLLFATISYDPTNATHVALAVVAVYDKLEIRRGLLGTDEADKRQVAWETKLSTLARLRGVSRVRPTANSPYTPSSPAACASGPVLPPFDRQNFDDLIPNDPGE